MDNFDYKKYLKEGKLLKEGFFSNPPTKQDIDKIENITPEYISSLEQLTDKEVDDLYLAIPQLDDPYYPRDTVGYMDAGTVPVFRLKAGIRGDQHQFLVVSDPDEGDTWYLEDTHLDENKFLQEVNQASDFQMGDKIIYTYSHPKINGGKPQKIKGKIGDHFGDGIFILLDKPFKYYDPNKIEKWKGVANPMGYARDSESWAQDFELFDGEQNYWGSLANVTKTINESNDNSKLQEEEDTGYGGNIINNEFMKMAKEWENFIDNHFLGKTITTKASKWSEDGHNWEIHTIPNIQETKLGSYFNTEIKVKDENGEWYTLLRQK